MGWVRSGVGVRVVAGAVPGHIGSGARAARGAAGRRAASAYHRLLRLHARRPRAQPLQQGRRRARQRVTHDAQRVDFLLFRGMPYYHLWLPRSGFSHKHKKSLGRHHINNQFVPLSLIVTSTHFNLWVNSDSFSNVVIIDASLFQASYIPTNFMSTDATRSLLR